MTDKVEPKEARSLTEIPWRNGTEEGDLIFSKSDLKKAEPIINELKGMRIDAALRLLDKIRTYLLTAVVK